MTDNYLNGVCRACAFYKGGVPASSASGHWIGRCIHCNKLKSVNAFRDWNWPNSENKLHDSIFKGPASPPTIKFRRYNSSNNPNLLYFDEALRCLKEGIKCCRLAWPEESYIELYDGSELLFQCDHDEGIKADEFLVMYDGVRRVKKVWNPSNSEILASDWLPWEDKQSWS